MKLLPLSLQREGEKRIKEDMGRRGEEEEAGRGGVEEEKMQLIFTEETSRVGFSSCGSLSSSLCLPLSSLSLPVASARRACSRGGR